MKRRKRQRDVRNGIDLIEEATHLLRTLPAGTLAIYFIGSIPFILGLLYFWVDTSRSPFAEERLLEGALAVTALFFWMKFFQALFARRVRAHISGSALPDLNIRRCTNIFISQAIIQPSGLFLVPLGMITVLPFAWIYAFYQNATAMADEERIAPWTLARKSWRQATLWPDQVHFVLMILFFFGLCVLLNWSITSILLPHLVKMLFGIESVFTRNTMGLLNTTFLTAMIGLTYLSVDPILKVVFALRCFYGESIHSGEDLRAELKRAGNPSAAAIGVVFLMLLLAAPARTAAAEESAAAPPSTRAQPVPAVSSEQLDRSIETVIQDRKYTWRMPRDTAKVQPEKGALAKFVEHVFRTIRDWIRAIRDWIEELYRKWRFQPKGGDLTLGTGWLGGMRVVVYLLIVVAIVALAYVVYRMWRGRQSTAAVTAEAVALTPDLTDENVGADQLPVDGWTQLARELLDRGEYRLALRAFYLASLAHLADRNLIQIARFKSNRDYQNELQRRAHAVPDLLRIFGGNVIVFERIWYGLHEASREMVEQFEADIERMKGAA